jgi:hypothetical protein
VVAEGACKAVGKEVSRCIGVGAKVLVALRMW